MPQLIEIGIFCAAMGSVVAASLWTRRTVNRMATLYGLCLSHQREGLTVDFNWHTEEKVSHGVVDFEATFAADGVPPFLRLTAAEPENQLLDLLSDEERSLVWADVRAHWLSVENGVVSVADRCRRVNRRKMRKTEERMAAAARVAITLGTMGPRTPAWLLAVHAGGSAEWRRFALEQLLTHYAESPEASVARRRVRNSGSVVERALAHEPLELPPEQLGELLNRALTLAAPGVAQHALMLLDRHRLLPTLDALARGAAQSENQLLYGLFANRMAALDHPEAEEEILKVFARRLEQPWVAWQIWGDVISALAKVGTSKSVTALRACAEGQADASPLAQEALNAADTIRARLGSTGAGGLALLPPRATEGALGLVQDGGGLALV